MRTLSRCLSTCTPSVLLILGGVTSGFGGQDAAPGEPRSAESLPISRGVQAQPDGVTEPFATGADHIVSQQCPDGGFGWPHADCSQTFNNITAPIGMGLLTAHERTRDPVHLVAATAGGDFDLTHVFMNGEPEVDPFTAYFLVELSEVSGDPAYRQFAAAFFDQLDAGTYGPDDLDTEGWITFHEARRTGTWVNLRPWHFSLYVETARQIGHPGQSEAMVAGILRGLETLDNSDPDNVYADILGLAGAIQGLSLADYQSFPPLVAPLHDGVNGIDNLVDLGNLLISYQNPDGSWFRHSNYPAPSDSDKGAQNTAYSVLALAALDRVTSESLAAPIDLGQSYLRSIQLPNGGFFSNPGGIENTTVEAEILWALGAGPAPLPIIEVPTLDRSAALILFLLLALLGGRLAADSRRPEA